MPDVTLPTPGEVEEMRERHVADYPGSALAKCVDCVIKWPCDAARLLALVDALRKGVGCPECHAPSWRELHEGRRRLAAVLAEVDRLDEDPGDVGPYALVADRIRRAAAGEAT